MKIKMYKRAAVAFILTALFIQCSDVKRGNNRTESRRKKRHNPMPLFVQTHFVKVE